MGNKRLIHVIYPRTVTTSGMKLSSIQSFAAELNKKQQVPSEREVQINNFNLSPAIEGILLFITLNSLYHHQAFQKEL